MKEVNLISYTQFKHIVDSKVLLAQYFDNNDAYMLFAIEGGLSWQYRLDKDGGDDQIDFESNYKNQWNKPLEYRSTDGLLKTASAKFADVKSLWLDGEQGCTEISAGQTAYMRKHFSFEFTLSGVDCRWYSSNFGDYIDFEVGFYIDESVEESFQSVAKFSNKYMIYGDGSRLFDVPTVRIIPEKIPGTNFNVYIRAKCVNVGPNSSKTVLNLVGWK